MRLWSRGSLIAIAGVSFARCSFVLCCVQGLVVCYLEGVALCRVSNGSGRYCIRVCGSGIVLVWISVVL